jgi:hypothetical protein
MYGKGDGAETKGEREMVDYAKLECLENYFKETLENFPF